MCPFCIGAAAWAAAGAVSAGGLGALAAFVQWQRSDAPRVPDDSRPAAEPSSRTRPGSRQH
jgi:hypothetical protein